MDSSLIYLDKIYNVLIVLWSTHILILHFSLASSQTVCIDSILVNSYLNPALLTCHVLVVVLPDISQS